MKVAPETDVLTIPVRVVDSGRKPGSRAFRAERPIVMKRKLSLLLAVTFLLGASLPLHAVDAPVLRVVVVQTDSPDAYVKEIDRGRGILKRLGSASTIRVWQARYAGDRAGAVIVAVESPNLTTFAKDEDKATSDPEYQAWMKDLSKLRKVTSDSLYREMK
jgi:hypothetical protein